MTIVRCAITVGLIPASIHMWPRSTGLHRRRAWPSPSWHTGRLCAELFDWMHSFGPVIASGGKAPRLRRGTETRFTASRQHVKGDRVPDRPTAARPIAPTASPARRCRQEALQAARRDRARGQERRQERRGDADTAGGQRSDARLRIKALNQIRHPQLHRSRRAENGSVLKRRVSASRCRALLAASGGDRVLCDQGVAVDPGSEVLLALEADGARMDAIGRKLVTAAPSLLGSTAWASTPRRSCS